MRKMIPERILVDRELAYRLEIAEGAANASSVDARAAASPETAACWIQVAGAYAMYDGASSPMTQTFGLGLRQLPSDDDMETLERFFRDRGAAVVHEVSPLADKALLPLLNTRGYRPIEFTSVLYLPLGGTLPESSAAPNLRVRIAGRGDREIWAQTMAKGWSDLAGLSDMILDLARVIIAREDSLGFLAELNGQPVAAAAMFMHERVALLAGACTVPEARKRGAQQALLHSRLQHAAKSGCDLASMGAEPGSSSQRNAERQGFRIAYTRVKWTLST